MKKTSAFRICSGLLLLALWPAAAAAALARPLKPTAYALHVTTATQ